LPASVAPAASAEPVDAPDDLDAFQEWAFGRRWSDGLAVLPPTRARVDRILGPHGARRDTLIATLAPLEGRATLEAIAVNAALAGAGPEHLPVIVAALRALAEPRFNLNAIQTTTHPCTPLVIVNGPIALQLGISGGPNALGNGHRANAVIGRAVRLTVQNVGGARPGQEDRATLGHPGKFSYCLAENEEASPWAPLHGALRGGQPRGLPPPAPRRRGAALREPRRRDGDRGRRAGQALGDRADLRRHALGDPPHLARGAGVCSVTPAASASAVSAPGIRRPATAR
jgi:hypothetical protein